MKKLLLSSLLLVSTAAPVLAHPQGGSEPKCDKQSKCDKQELEKPVPSGEMLMAHASLRQPRIQELLKIGKMSVSLMKLSHQQMTTALGKKDHSEVEKALQTFQAARELHEESMTTLEMMNKRLNEHLKHVKSGAIKLTPDQAIAFENEVALFTQQLNAYRADCSENVLPKNQAMRKNALSFLMQDFADAEKAQQAEKMLHIAHIMKLLPPFKANK